MTVAEMPVFILTAQKRGVRRPEGARVGSLTDWEKDPGFEERWGNRTPDIGVQRSQIPGKLQKRAQELNEAQLRSGFLDWLYVVDVDAPVHECGERCKP